MILNKYRVGLSVVILTVFGVTACQQNTSVTETSATAASMETQIESTSESNEVVLPASNITNNNAASQALTAPPQLHIVDPLSSSMNQFSINSGNYEWNYPDKDEMTGVVACGAHPLDIIADNTEKLDVPDYNGMEAVPYVVSCDIMPDELLIKEWDIDALGNTDLEADKQVAVENSGMIELIPGKIYEITAVWTSDNLENRGFFGQASYSLVTE